MIRDVDRLSAGTFDLLVVGGGIYGVTLACDAAQRGLSVALVERDDFGAGSSFNHLRTIHGGLRYLQSLDLRRSRESMLERRALAQIAPHAVAPLPFVLPLTHAIARGPLALRAAFLLDRLVGIGRNRGVPAALRLPGGHVVSRGAAILRYPGLRRQGLAGAAVWHDYVTTEPDRLTFAWALAAAAHGASLANHMEAVTPLVDGRRVVGVRARDAATGRTIDIGARVTVNATGGSVDRLLAPLGLSARVPMLKAMNLVTRRDAGAEALGGRSESGRHLFLVPWRERALFGTWESASVCPPGDASVSEADIAAFIRELNQAFPSLDLKLADVTLVHRGIVPAVVSAGGRATLQGHEQVRDHAAEGVDGLLTVAGTKYTTARAIAERLTTSVFAKLGRPAPPCRTATTPLPGGGLRDTALTIAEARRDHDAGLPSDTIPHLVGAYGTRYRDVLEAAADRPELRRSLGGGSPVIGAELVWAAREEMVGTLADAVLRRTPLGALGYPGDAACARAASMVGAELGWTPARQEREIEALRAFYAPIPATAP